MRLLAYGGTGYYERQRIGAWENAPRDALDDSFRLEEEQPTFGLCLIDEAPVLVVRQLQITKTGRAYAYSLLLDPGPSVWRRFKWDAAGLAAALFNEEVELSKLLLEQPEKLSAQYLEEFLDRLAPKAEGHSDGPIGNVVSDFEAAWIGAFFTSSISSWPPQIFGFATRPSFAEASKLLRRLPPCFRAGLGWLIGTSSQSARNFGAQFSIDDRVEVDSTLPDLIRHGSQIHQALKTLSNDDDFAETADRLLLSPVWEWAGDARENPAPLVERLSIIASLLKTVPEDDNLLRVAVENLPQTGFLNLDLRRAWQRNAFAFGQMLTAEQTSFALDNYFHAGLPLTEDNISLLDPEKLAERFVHDGLEPSGSNVPHLPLATRHKVWSALLLQTGEHEDLPGIFFRAIEDLGEEDKTRRYAPLLAQVVSDRMIHDESFSLLYWQRYQDKPYWRSASQMLRDIARNRARSRTRDWQIEYLLFAEDDGAAFLIEQPTSKREWREIITRFVNLVRTDQEYAPAARRWLQGLAYCSIRTMGVLNYDDKLQIGRAVGGGWLPYLDLWDAYCNQAPVLEPRKVPSEKDKQILLKELDDLISQNPVKDFVPDLSGLETMVGSLSKKTMSYFQELTPNPSKPSDFGKWVSAWGSRDPGRASKETVRYFLEGDGDVEFSDYWLNAEFEEKQIEALFSTLLFRSYLARDKRYRRRLRELLTKALAKDAKRILNVVRRIFKDGIDDETHATVFCKRFAHDRDAIEVLVRCLPRTTSGIALTDALYKFDPTRFVAEACDAWRAVTNRNTALTPYQYSLMFHLHKKKGTRLQVERVLEDANPGKPVSLKLDEILKVERDQELFPEQLEQKDSVEEVEEIRQQATDNIREPEGYSLGERIKSFLGFGSARKANAQRGAGDERTTGDILGLRSARRNAGKGEDSTDDSTPRNTRR